MEIDMSRKRKKSAPIVNTAPVSTKSAEKSKKILLIIISAVLGAAILVGAVFGIVLGVRNASYAAYIDGVGIDEGVANYLAAYFKADYKAILAGQLSGSSVTVTDTPAFWSTKVHPDVETTYADYLRLYVEDAIRNVLAANAIFDMRLTLEYEDRAEIAVATEEILTYWCGGDKSVFNDECEKYGFDYNDFKAATEMLYKATMLRTKLFGGAGEKMSLYSDECNEFFGKYKKFKILFIRTDKMIDYIDGEPQLNDDGTYKTVDIVEGTAEYNERMNDIAKLQGIIDGEYDYALFDELWKKYEKENEKQLYGCYLMQDSSYTKKLSEKYSKIVSAAFELEENSFVRVDDKSSDDGNTFIGSTFILREKNSPLAYSLPDEYGYFDDFNSLAASTVMQDMIDEIEGDVELRDRWKNISLVDIPYLETFVADF